MDRCGLLLEVMAFSLESSLCLSLFFETWLPLFLSLFFGPCFFGMPSFLFLGQRKSDFIFFRDVLQERSPRHGAFIDVERMDGGANS